MISFTTIPDNLPSSGVAVSLGMFDGLHRGHLAVLDAMMSNSNGLGKAVFTFSTDTARPKAKTGLHLLSREMRDSLLRELRVDYIIEPDFSEIMDMTPEEFVIGFLLDRLNAKKVFCGEDFRFGKNASGGIAKLRELLSDRAELFASPVLYEGGDAISTTRIRGLIQNGNIEMANLLLGRPFAIDFAVEHGRELGRTWGMPTINQAFPKNFTVPKFGVYASVAVVGGESRCSVTNIGVKPTVGSDHVLAETYIHDFSGDLYGERVPVKLIKFIREERKFAGAEELRTRIECDKKLATKIFDEFLR